MENTQNLAGDMKNATSDDNCDATEIKEVMSRSCQTDDISIIDLLAEEVLKDPDLQKALKMCIDSLKVESKDLYENFIGNKELPMTASQTELVENTLSFASCSNGSKNLCLEQDFIDHSVDQFLKNLKVESNIFEIPQIFSTDVIKAEQNSIDQDKIPAIYNYSGNDNNLIGEVLKSVLKSINKELACNEQIDKSNNSKDTSSEDENTCESEEEFLLSEFLNNED